jgi:hypothetical protein
LFPGITAQTMSAFLSPPMRGKRREGGGGDYFPAVAAAYACGHGTIPCGNGPRRRGAPDLWCWECTGQPTRPAGGDQVRMRPRRNCGQLHVLLARQRHGFVSVRALQPSPHGPVPKSGVKKRLPVRLLWQGGPPAVRGRCYPRCRHDHGECPHQVGLHHCQSTTH